MEEIIESHDNTMNAQHHKAVATPDKVIQCSTWDLNMDPVRLPALPPLPALVEIKEETKLIKIAGFDQKLIGLTNQGHVLKFDSLGTAISASRGTWSYVRSNRLFKVQQY
jgi:SCF-associated factor 1